MGWLLLKTVASLLGVLALMVAVVWAIKRFVVENRSRGGNIVEIDILGQRALQPKRSILVVQVLNKVLVVGNTEEGMRTLTEIDDEDVLRQLTAARIQEETRYEGFVRKGDLQERQAKTFADFLVQNMGLMKSRIVRRRKGDGAVNGGRNR
jgi:flagellar biosynthetic protein FliO